MIVVVAEEWRKRPDGKMERVRVVTEDRPDAEVKAERAAHLRDQAWAEVEAVVDSREMVAHLGVLVGFLLEKAALTAEEGAAIGPALQALGAIQARLEGWGEVQAALDAAEDWEAIQRVELPASPPIPAARAADVARALKARG